jgi:hypothetical protein
VNDSQSSEITVWLVATGDGILLKKYPKQGGEDILAVPEPTHATCSLLFGFTKLQKMLDLLIDGAPGLQNTALFTDPCENAPSIEYDLDVCDNENKRKILLVYKLNIFVRKYIVL